MRYGLLFILSLTYAYGFQSVNVSGEVRDEQGQPVPFANAALFSASDSTLIAGAVTETSGRFVIAATTGLYYLTISFISYQPKVISDIKVESETINLGIIVLTENTQLLKDVVVQGEKSQMSLSLDKRVFEVGKDLSNISGSVADILDNVPSVSVDVEGNVSLRGSQNVRILIDGKPSSLTGINMADAMRQLQGNMIERIEIITNPSSHYDAEGEVGILNIILKKEKITTGSFSLNTGYPDNYGGSFNINLRKKKLNYFAGYGINYRSTPGQGSSTQYFELPDTSFYYQQISERLRTGLSHSARAGVDYTFTDGGVLTASALMRYSAGLNKTTNTYDDFTSEGKAISTIVRNEREKEPEKNMEGSLSYRKEFEKKGRILSADAKWIENRETEYATFEQYDATRDSTGYQQSWNTENERNVLIQTDYTHAFGTSAKFETGLKGTMRVINNNFSVEQLNEMQDWTVLPALTNDLTYYENIYAGYFMVGSDSGKFSWQAGVRGELSDIEVELATTEEETQQNYFNLFPSAHFAFRHAPERTIQLSYSYRLSRPDFRDLLPFSNYSDNRSVRVGNPNLKPEYTHSMEAGYLMNFDFGSVLSSVYYRYRTGVIENITQLDSLAVTRIMPVNLASENAYGFEFNVTLNPTQWWRFNGNANLYRAITEGNYNESPFYSDTYTMTSRTTSQFTLWKKWNLQTGFNYRAPRITTQGRDRSLYYLDASLSRDVLKGNGTITFSVRDVFNTRRYRSVIRRPDLGYETQREFQWRARQFLLTFSYRLNLQKNSGKESEADDEEDIGD